MGRCRRLTRMRQMDPQRDFEQIYRWITQYEFPRDYLHGTSVAFLRDYGVPASPDCSTAPRSSSVPGRSATTTRC